MLSQGVNNPLQEYFQGGTSYSRNPSAGHVINRFKSTAECSKGCPHLPPEDSQATSREISDDGLKRFNMFQQIFALCLRQACITSNNISLLALENLDLLDEIHYYWFQDKPTQSKQIRYFLSRIR